MINLPLITITNWQPINESTLLHLSSITTLWIPELILFICGLFTLGALVKNYRKS